MRYTDGITRPELEFFDCNTCLGRPMNLPSSHFGPTDFSADSLLKALDRAGIARALVWHASQRDFFPGTGNALLMEAIAGRDRLIPCWTALPPQTGELGGVDGFFAAASKSSCVQSRVG